MNHELIEQQTKEFLKNNSIQKLSNTDTSRCKSIADVKKKYPHLARQIMSGERPDHKTNSRGYVPNDE